jgi:hypothetical protein
VKIDEEIIFIALWCISGWRCRAVMNVPWAGSPRTLYSPWYSNLALYQVDYYVLLHFPQLTPACNHIP